VAVIITDAKAAKKARDDPSSTQLAWPQLHAVEAKNNILTLIEALPPSSSSFSSSSRRGEGAVASEQKQPTPAAPAAPRREVTFDLRGKEDANPPPDEEGKEWGGLDAEAQAARVAAHVAAVLARMKKMTADAEEAARVSGVSEAEMALPEVTADEGGPVFLTLAPPHA